MKRLLPYCLAPCLTFGLAFAEKKPEIFLCEDEDGNLVYQTVPCPEPEETHEPVPVRVEAPNPPPKPKPKPAPKKKPVPPPTVRTDPHALRSVTTWAVVPSLPNTGRAARVRFGEQTFPTRVESTDSNAPAFDSPQSTWRTFLAALEADDRAGAAACLTPAARADHADDEASFPVEEIRRLVRSFTRIDDKGDLGVFWSASGVRPDRRPKWILFEETARGVWKIAGI